MRQKAVLLFLSLVITTTLFLQPEAAMRSGAEALPKLTKEEIAGVLMDDFQPLPSELFETAPSVTAPYSTGKLTLQAQETALARFNAIRLLAGVPAVSLDPELSAAAQYGAVLLSASDYSHYPKQPEDMPDDFYRKGKAATSSSNLYIGQTLITAVDRFMNDSDPMNLPHLGHRRWQLSPWMSKTGFGFVPAVGDRKSFVVQKVMDLKAEPFDYDFISWPSSGNFPKEFFSGNIAWSIQLNPKRYSIPNLSDVTVTLKGPDNLVFEFANSGSYTASKTGKYFHASSASGLPGPCIIFRPADFTKYDGHWTVSVTGIVTKSDKQPVTLEYEVDFFDMAKVEKSPYQDVSRSHPLYPDIKTAYESGWLKETKTLDPDDKLTKEFLGSLLGYSIYQDSLPTSTTKDISGLCLSLLEEKDIPVPEEMTYDSMARMLLHVLKDKGAYIPSDSGHSDPEECVRLGLLADGTEDSSLTRGEGIQIITALNRYLSTKD